MPSSTLADALIWARNLLKTNQPSQLLDVHTPELINYALVLKKNYAQNFRFAKKNYAQNLLKKYAKENVPF